MRKKKKNKLAGFNYVIKRNPITFCTSLSNNRDTIIAGAGNQV
jgi:hypothetical protein